MPTSLYYDLLPHLPKRLSASVRASERASDMSRELRTTEDSTFYGRVVLTPPRKGQLSINNFVRKVGPLVTPEKGRFNLYGSVPIGGVNQR